MAYEENRAYAEKPLSDEQVEINYLKNTVSRLEDLVGALCATNFLTQHEDGDEEVREHAVNRVNRQYRRYADDFRTKKEIAALEEQKREIEQKIEEAKYGTLKYNVTERYATSLGNAIINTQNVMNQAVAVGAFPTQVLAPADKLEAAAQIVKLATGSK